MNKVISFPNLDNYAYPAYYVLSHISSCRIIKPLKITDKTIELGAKYSPDFVCTPFKYTLGTLLESVDKGANYLVNNLKLEANDLIFIIAGNIYVKL